MPDLRFMIEGEISNVDPEDVPGIKTADPRTLMDLSDGLAIYVEEVDGKDDE